MSLFRHTLTREITLGSLYLNGAFFCYTLEDADRLGLGFSKIPGKTAIPTGVYRVGISFSNRFSKDMPIVKGVPEFTGIRFHPGNKEADTSGCILVGGILTDNSIHGSTVAYNNLFERMKGVPERDQMFLYVERVAMTSLMENVLREAFREDLKGLTT